MAQPRVDATAPPQQQPAVGQIALEPGISPIEVIAGAEHVRHAQPKQVAAAAIEPLQGTIDAAAATTPTLLRDAST